MIREMQQRQQRVQADLVIVACKWPAGDRLIAENGTTQEPDAL
jgi:hypothetical protein